MVPLCLERAGAAPITVNISDIRKDRDLLQALVPHVSRISNLSITGHSLIGGVKDNLSGLFPSPMPNLTFLGLKQIVQPAKLFPSNEISPPPLFYNIFKLKSLRLTRVPFYPILYKIPSLVELKLAGYTIPFGEFIGFLGSYLALEIIDLNLRFTEGSVSTTPERTVSLPQLRQLVFACNDALDARGLFSCLSLPRSVNIEVRASKRSLRCDLASFLPCPPTPIQDLLTPMTTIKYRDTPKQFHLSSNDSSFIFHSQPTTLRASGEFDLFATGAIRECHLYLLMFDHQDLANCLPWVLERLPALEALAISGPPLRSGSLSALTKKPILCRSLKTVAFLNCKVTGEVIKELEEIATEREHSMAARLHRVVIVNDKLELPDFDFVKRLQRFVPHVDVGIGDQLPDLM